MAERWELGVGGCIKRWIAKFGIKSENCPSDCARLARLMDIAGPGSVRANADEWAKLMQASAAKWVHPDNPTWLAPPRIAFKQIILFACDHIERQQKGTHPAIEGIDDGGVRFVGAGDQAKAPTDLQEWFL